MRVVVTATNTGGSTPATSNQTATIAVAPPAAAPTNTALPSISGTTTQGQTLTAANGSWTGGLTTYAYQWRDCDSSGNNCTNISGATSSTYTLTSNDVGDTMRVVVTATNTGGSTPATSNQTATIAVAPPAAAPTNTALPSDQRDHHPGPDPDRRQRLLDRRPHHLRLPVARLRQHRQQLHQHQRRHQQHLRPDQRRRRHTLRVVVTASNTGGSTPATSGQTAVVQPPPAPTNTALPAISGTTTQGQTLTAANGSWTGGLTTYAYQWRDCDSTGNNCTNIAGATSQHLRPDQRRRRTHPPNRRHCLQHLGLHVRDLQPDRNDRRTTPGRPDHHRAAHDQRHHHPGPDPDYQQRHLERQPDRLHLPVARLRQPPATTAPTSPAPPPAPTP